MSLTRSTPLDGSIGGATVHLTPTAATQLQPAEERALRVSLLARLPEVAVRAVAKEAGLPNWAWLDPRQDPNSRWVHLPTL